MLKKYDIYNEQCYKKYRNYRKIYGIWLTSMPSLVIPVLFSCKST